MNSEIQDTDDTMVTPDPETMEISAAEWTRLKLCGAETVLLTKDDYIDLLRSNLAMYRALSIKRAPQALDAAGVARAFQLHAQGMPVRRIAALVGRSKTIIGDLLSGKAGV